MKKIFLSSLCLGVLLTTPSALNAQETERSNDNIAYKLYVPGYQQNSDHTAGRYRQTTNNDNKWKVNQTSTLEGTGSSGNKTTYWLEKSGGSNVSSGVTVSSADAPVYTRAYSSASQQTVYLTAENNNYNGDQFYVNGYWDEETD